MFQELLVIKMPGQWCFLFGEILHWFHCMMVVVSLRGIMFKMPGQWCFLFGEILRWFHCMMVVVSLRGIKDGD